MRVESGLGEPDFTQHRVESRIILEFFESRVDLQGEHVERAVFANSGPIEFQGNVLGRQNSDVSTLGNQEKVWANSVSASVVASVSKKERNRQEAIFEVVNTESNYVRDLELMEEVSFYE